MRALQYLILTLFVCAMAYAIMKPITNRIGASLERSAHMIENPKEVVR